MRAILTVIFGLTLAGAAMSADLPVAPPSPMVDPYAGQTLSKAPLARTFEFGGARFSLPAEPLGGMPGRLGAGTIQTASVRYLCYDLPQARQRVWLSSTDEGGDGTAVDTVTVKRLDAGDPKSAYCPALSAKFQPVRIDGAVQIGTTRAELVKRLGAPSLDTAGWLVFRGEDGQWGQSLTVRLEGDKVVFIQASNTVMD